MSTGGMSFGISGEQLARELQRLGLPLSTALRVNGRWMLVEAVLRLLVELPEETRYSRRGLQLQIDPDPFAFSPFDQPASDESAPLVARFLECQPETDRQAARERRWYHRLLRRTGPDPAP